MTALHGISSQQTALSTLNMQEATPASATHNKAGAVTGAQTPAAAAQADRASLSAAGGLAGAQGPDHSDVRLGKVAELRQAIANGTYNVPASAVADKIVESLLR